MSNETSKLGKIEFIDIKKKWELFNMSFALGAIFLFFATIISFFINIRYFTCVINILFILLYQFSI